MIPIVYSQEAIDDLVALRAFIATANATAAAAVAADLLSRIERNRDVPGLGRRVTAAPDADVLRDAIFGKYIVRYALRRGVIFVLRIWHHLQQRDLSE